MCDCFLAEGEFNLFLTFKQIFVQFSAEQLWKTKRNQSVGCMMITKCHLSYQCRRVHSWQGRRLRSPVHYGFGSTPRSCGQRWTRWRWLTASLFLCCVRQQPLCSFHVDFSRYNTHIHTHRMMLESGIRARINILYGRCLPCLFLKVHFQTHCSTALSHNLVSRPRPQVHVKALLSWLKTWLTHEMSVGGSGGSEGQMRQKKTKNVCIIMSASLVQAPLLQFIQFAESGWKKKIHTNSQ